MKRWLFPALLAASFLIAAAPPGTFVFTGDSWLFPLGATQTLWLRNGIASFFGSLEIGINNANFLNIRGNSTGGPIIVSTAGTDSAVGLTLTTKGASSVTVYPGTNLTSAFVVRNASQSVQIFDVNTVNARTETIAANLTSGVVISSSVATLGIQRSTLSGTNLAAGAGGARFEVTCGFNAGTAALVAYAGTSTVSTVVVNNIGSGVAGC